MNKTKIEWVKNPDGSSGYSWNPITGCLNGCDYCYARKLANTRLRERYLANDIIGETDSRTSRLRGSFADPFFPRFWSDKAQIFHDQTLGMKPRGIFVCNMGDLFGIGVPELWTRGLIKDMGSRHPQHRFYLLTKQPQNLIKFSPFPDNCWVGVTATDQEMFIDALMELQKVEAKVKYISFEPLQEAMNGGECDGERLDGLVEAGIKWVIIGSQTKPNVYPSIEAVREIVEACDKAGVKVFLKDSLKPLLLEDAKHNIYSYPEWASKQFAVTTDGRSPMRLLKHEMPK